MGGAASKAAKAVGDGAKWVGRGVKAGATAAAEFVMTPFVTALDNIRGTPQRYNDTQAAIRHQEELERLRRESERLAAEEKARHAEALREQQRLSEKEQERYERQMRDEQERYERQERARVEELERKESQRQQERREEQERYERQWREEQERQERQRQQERREEQERYERQERQRQQERREEQERYEQYARQEQERHEGERREEQERHDRQEREARERHEREQREQQERHERERQEEQERHERQRQQEREEQEAAAAAEREEQQRMAEEARIRHEERLRQMAEEYEARLAQQKEEAARLQQEQEERARKAQEEFARKQEELESKLRAGIQPEVWPTSEERRHAEDRLLQPRSEFFHCAIAGVSGSGKSSLINAFRGLRNNSPGAARTGVRETTLEISAFRDPSTTMPRSRFVWYDIPGAGTLRVPGWQYFNSQGLFVFDLIIVVTDNRFSEQDMVILKQCERYKIPSFLVRSKANQHIENLMGQDYGWDGSDDERDFDEVYQQARETLVSETRSSIAENLLAGGLDPAKEVFIVSCNALASLVRGETSRLRGKDQMIDEPKLVLTCLETVRARRF